MRKKIARIGNRERSEFRQSASSFRRPDSRFDGRDRRNSLIIQRFWLKSSAFAARAGGVGAIAAEQNAHVHFVGLALEPSEKTATPYQRSFS